MTVTPAGLAGGAVGVGAGGAVGVGTGDPGLAGAADGDAPEQPPIVTATSSAAAATRPTMATLATRQDRAPNRRP